MSGYLIIVCFLVFVLLKIPIAFCFLIPSILYLWNAHIPMEVAIQKISSSCNSYTMIAIPLFVYAGCLMNYSGVSDYLLKMCKALVGRLKGALAYCNILTSLIFAGTSGSALADIGGIGKVVLHAMKQDGYSEEDAIGITAASSTIGPIFPPSIPLMVFAMAASVSSADLLIAGIVPALILTGVLFIYIKIQAEKKGFPKDEISYTRKELFATILKCAPACLIPVFLITGMTMGRFGPTALAAMSCLATIFLGVFFYKGLTWKCFIAATREALHTSANILFIICSAGLFSHALTLSQITRDIGELLLGLTSNPTVLLLLCVVFLSIMGLFIDATAAILITTPIILPVTTSLGISPIQLGIVMVLTLMIGLLTPPVGMSLYMLSDISKTPLSKVISGVSKYYIPLYIVLLLTVLIPGLTTFALHIL